MKSVFEIDKNHLCIGCGFCTGISASNETKLEEGSDGFLHPVINPINHWKEIKAVCPGLNYTNKKIKLKSREEKIWGPFEDIKLCHSTDETVRWLGSSGGAISSILLFLFDKKIIDAVLQTGPSVQNPLRTDTFINSSKEDILRCASSRYCPSSPLSKIGDILSTGRNFAFVGRPCDISALWHYLDLHPEYRPQIKLMLSFFCASTPSYNATDLILKKMNISQEHVLDFWYRGKGWPGYTTAVLKNGEKFKLTYEAAWGDILSDHAHFRCKICPDGIGFFADIVLADGWEIKNGTPDFCEKDGQNIIIPRNEIGNKYFLDAVKAGYIQINDFDFSSLKVIQPAHYHKRTNIGARIFALRTCGLLYPKFNGYPIYSTLQFKKPFNLIKSYLGTIKRKLKQISSFSLSK